MNNPDLSALEVLLKQRGLEAVLPVRLAGERIGCTVWTGWIRSPNRWITTTPRVRISFVGFFGGAIAAASTFKALNPDDR